MWPAAGQPPLGYNCVLWERRKDGSGHLARAAGGTANTRISCMVSVGFTIYYQKTEEETFQVDLCPLKFYLSFTTQF